MDRGIVSCRNPSHGDKWLLTSHNDESEKPPCFACCMLSLEDKQELTLRKRVILSCFRDLMDSNAHVLISVASEDDQVVLHAVHVFLGLLKWNDEGLIKLSGECLLLFLIHMKNEGLSLAVMQRLTVEIEENCNYAQNSPQIRILGQLFQLLPGLVQLGKCAEPKFLHILANGLNYPSDEVKDAILFLLRQIYGNIEIDRIPSRPLDTVFVKSFLRILKSTQNKHLFSNSLGLLRIFICNVMKSFNDLFEISLDEVNFTDIVKKTLLSNEPACKISVVQCICQLLINTLFEKHITLLLDANIPEILFDALSTKDELLLESILCCLNLFVLKAEDTVKSQFVFGIGILIEVCSSLLDLRNWKLLCTTLNLLTSIISSNQYLMTSSHITFYYQTVQFTEKAFKVQNPTVLLTVCNFFTEFLKNNDLPWALPSDQIYINVNIYLKSQLKFISSLTISECVKNHTDTSKPLSTEMELFICSFDMISSCIRLCKKYTSNPVAVETGFTCPNLLNGQSANQSVENSSENLIYLCLSSLDEYLIPCVFQLKSTNYGRLAWHHLAQVLAVIFDELQVDTSTHRFAKKLIRAGILKYLFGMKVNKAPFGDCSTSEQVKSVCNLCVKGLLKCILRSENYSDSYRRTLDIGILQLDDSLEECANVLSQKSNRNDGGMNEFWASPTQLAYLCLCYVSYLNEAFVVNVETLVPHLICFVTCNSDLLSSCIILLKHLIFLMAVCTYECIYKNMKFRTELLEANIIIWELLSEMKTPSQVYTHHKHMLLWCFKNQTCNAFSSDVLQTWLTFCVDKQQNLRLYAMKTVTQLLCSCRNAQQTFVLLFDFCSSTNNEILIEFLKEAYELQISSSEASMEGFHSLIVLMIYHLYSFLEKLFILKSDNDAVSGKILCQGLDCLLWCHKQTDNCEIDAKLIFYISKYCLLDNFSIMDTVTACVKFLQFTLTHEKHCEKAWHVMTGSLNISSFFYKCFNSHSELEVEALNLLLVLFDCQVKCNLKSNVHVQIPPKQIFKWLNATNTQIIASHLLNLVIMSEFQATSIVFISLDCDSAISQNEQYPCYRLFYLYLQSTIISENPVILDETITSFLLLLNIISKTNKNLECHIMLQPWIKILMESQLEKSDESTWKLLEKWLTYNKVNTSLIGVIQQFSSKLQAKDFLNEIERRCADKLLAGTYTSFISSDTRAALKRLTEENLETNHPEKDLVTQVQDIVTSYLYKPVANNFSNHLF